MIAHKLSKVLITMSKDQQKVESKARSTSNFSSQIFQFIFFSESDDIINCLSFSKNTLKTVCCKSDIKLFWEKS